MNRDEMKGKARNVEGRVKQATGTLTGNKRLESEGADERNAGAVQEGVGRARRKVGEAMEKMGKEIKK